ncbi:MAG TPA: alpha/beta hydrolase [Candidatus Baltobacteraceae bacterium]|nr:alpha/beta hydrolase [Candidatus Baltobacteraceae bacterium]
MRVNSDDATIDVATDGSGDAIVLIHGFPFTKEIWNAQSAQLSKRAQTIRPDLRGFGSSSVPSGPYLMETFAGDLAAVLDAMKIDRASIVGHSMGGYVAMAFARMYTERVSKLVLVCSKLKNDSDEAAANREKLASEIERDVRSALFESPYFTGLFAPETLKNKENQVRIAREIAQRNQPAGLAAAQRGMAQRVDARDIAEDLDFPVLVVAGGRDPIVSLEEAEETRAAFPHADLRVLGASGHVPMVEEPEALSEVLEGFLSAGAPERSL